jgi:uncharacterized protein (DUF924 family)
MTTPEDIIEFWYGSDADRPLQNAESWFKKDDAFDREIEDRFGSTLKRAEDGELEDWCETPRGRLGYIIVLDQFSRNMYRGEPDAFLNDSQALDATLEGIDLGHDTELEPQHCWFFYMPLMHSESPEIQQMSLEKYRELAELDGLSESMRSALENAYDFAEQHAEIIEEFGRYPHRNDVLGRESTDAEKEYLKRDDAGF